MMQRDDEMLDGLAREFIGQLPAAERDEALAAWTSADESARTAMLAKLAARVDDVPMWSMSTFYAGLSFTNYAQCADALMNRFISVPVAEAQRGVILAALGAGADPAAAVTSDAIPAEKQKAALHLVLSMAEYQLC